MPRKHSSPSRSPHDRLRPERAVGSARTPWLLLPRSSSYALTTAIGVIQQPAPGESRGRIHAQPVVAGDDPLLSSHNERQRHGCFDPGHQNQRESFATQSIFKPGLPADDSPRNERRRQHAGGLGGAIRVARAVRELYFPDPLRLGDRRTIRESGRETAGER